MHAVLRKTGLASLLAGAAFAAAAAPVTIGLNFDNLTLQSDASQKAVAVGEAYKAQGVLFDGATAMHTSLLTSFDTDAPPDGLGRPTSHPYFAQNNGVAGSFSVIGLTAAGKAIQSLTFGLSVGNSTVTVFGLDANGVEVDVELLTSGSNWSWLTAKTVDFTNAAYADGTAAVVERLEFRGLFFALDDLVLTVAGTDPGGTVPEPASYGLAAIALLAAGAASKRRRNS